MTIQECYQEIGGNYESVLKRFMSPNLVKKFIGKFLDDGSYDALCKEMDAGNREEAFRAAHTLKGVCQNLGLGRLSVSSGLITDILRVPQDIIPEEAVVLMETVKNDYRKTVDAIRTYLESEA
ncbi:MAG: Hpt domain-containing protein [Bariatricus sp.]|nr:Hpt domain-containing protein [Bariatricus sp.]